MRQSLWREVWILAGLTGLGLAIGLFTTHVFLFPFLGLCVYIALQLRQLKRLHTWLLAEKGGEVPEAPGLWGDVFNEIRKLVRQSEQRSDELNDLLVRFQSASAAMPDAVVILSENEEIEWANPAAEHLLGLDYPRDAGVRLANLIRDPQFTDYLARANFAEPLEMDSPADPHLMVSLQLISFGAQRRLVIGRDITRLTRLEQMRRTFVANVSHELRTPITVLGGYLETLRSLDNLDPNELKKHLAVMHEQAGRMQRLVDDLLTLSRLETAPPRQKDETVDVPSLLAGLREQAEILSGEAHHRITLDAEPNLQLLGSREELHSAFMNVIQNAVRYTPAGGNINLRWATDAEGAKFSVTDSGEGIAAEHIPHLTDRFYRVDTARSRDSGGTGLGLSIVKHVLLRHDAELRIDSEIGVGSTFICAFPTDRLIRSQTSTKTVRA
ncbi:MAG: phosphate regulon sensor histidine kinase PhoR [Gammaproteobacteria bacterium]|nr:phosphate regulon sensor histidine kinase PhoR [Gammaproteobacteria bacterium]